jgi:hypothetical protein
MNPETVARVITRGTPLPATRRAPYNAYAAHAETVARMVASGWTVTEAVNRVVITMRLARPVAAFLGIKARYYANRRKGTKKP